MVSATNPKKKISMVTIPNGDRYLMRKKTYTNTRMEGGSSVSTFTPLDSANHRIKVKLQPGDQGKHVLGNRGK